MRSFSISFLVVAAASTVAWADPIPVPNYSFEMPLVMRDEQNPFGALPYIDDWDETMIGPADEFDQNTGVFLNTDAMSADHITNPEQDRLAFISSLVGNTVRQELTATYQVGVGYSFTAAIGKSFSFPVGATEELQIALFWFNGGAEQIIASQTVMGSQVGTTSLADFTVSIPMVQAGDAWANKQIGVLVRPSPADPDDAGGEGFWNVDNARVNSTSSIPAVSTWGLICLALTMTSAGTIVVRRREAYLV